MITACRVLSRTGRALQLIPDQRQRDHYPVLLMVNGVVTPSGRWGLPELPGSIKCDHMRWDRDALSECLQRGYTAQTASAIY